MNNKENLRRATAEMVILFFLLNEDLYVYDLTQRIEKQSNGVYTVPEATIYPIMYRLTEKRYIEEFNRMINKRMRKYYHITESGRTYYLNLLQEYRNTLQGIESIFNSGAHE